MTQSQLEQAVFANIAVWNTSGLGSPTVLPVNHPVFWFWHFAAMLLSSAAVLKITLLCAFTAMGLGTYALVRRTTGLPVWAAFFVGLWAMLGPAIFVKFIAGHLYYLISFGAFPWALYALFAPSRSLRFALAAGVLASLTVIQPQLYVALIAAFICTGLLGARIPLRNLALAIAASLLLAVPAAYLAATVGGAGSGLAAFQTLRFWEYNNSAHMLDALVALGYFTGYAEHAYALLPFGGIARDLLYVIPALALLGLVANLRSGMARAFALLWFLTFGMVAGLYGPFSAPLAAAFDRWPVFSIFRELYHFAAPMWLFACMLAAFGLSRLDRRIQVLAVTAGTLAVFALWLPAHFAGQLYSWQPDAHAVSAIRSLAADSEPDRFLVLPARNPVAPGSLRQGGVNPFAYAVGSHAQANEYNASPDLEVAIAYARDGDPRAASWLDLLGIGECFSAPSLHSTFASTVIVPKRWPAVLPRPKALLSRTPSCPQTLQHSPQAIITRDLQFVQNPLEWTRGPAFLLQHEQQQIAPVVSDRTTDPSAAWVRSYLWSWISPQIAAAGSRAALTWSNEFLPVPSFAGGRTAVRLYALGSGLVTDRGARISIPSGSNAWVMLPAGTRSIRRTGEGIVVASAFIDARLLKKTPQERQGGGSSEALAFDADSLSMSVSASGDFWIVLKQRFSPFWIARVEGGAVLAHRVAGGYANAWHVRCAGRCALQVAYQPQRVARPLVYCSLLAWLLAALASAISFKAPRRFASLSR